MGQEAVQRKAVHDVNEVLSVDEACGYLAVSRATLYRLEALPRVQLSAGRVGYRYGDLLNHVRAQSSPVVQLTTAFVDDAGGTIGAGLFLSLSAHINTIVRRRPRTPGAKLSFTVELPSAVEWWRNGHRDLVLIDYDGLNSTEPMIVIPQEGEPIGPRQRLTVTRPHAMVRLVPLFGWPEKMPDGWWVESQ